MGYGALGEMRGDLRRGKVGDILVDTKFIYKDH
jgi:hypothetical protein